MPNSLSDLPEPTLADVYAARRRITGQVLRTPVRRYPVLCDLLDADVWVKHENMQLLGAFKVRGGMNLAATINDDERARGFITASTGNHGQSIAYAAQVSGAQCTIVVPVGANPVKVGSMQKLGATVIEHGPTFDEAKLHSEVLAAEEGMRYVHPANEPLLVAGVGTYALEIHEDLDDIDAIIVPVGAGSGACGTAIVTDAIAPDTQVVGAQSEAAPSVYLSWEAGDGPTIDAPMRSEAEGIATGSSYDFPVGILRKRLADFRLVSESAIRDGIVKMFDATRTIVEHAGAVALAAALSEPDRWRGKRLVLVASGGNLSVDQLRDVFGTG